MVNLRNTASQGVGLLIGRQARPIAGADRGPQDGGEVERAIDRRRQGIETLLERGLPCRRACPPGGPHRAPRSAPGSPSRRPPARAGRPGPHPSRRAPASRGASRRSPMSACDPVMTSPSSKVRHAVARPLTHRQRGTIFGQHQAVARRRARSHRHRRGDDVPRGRDGPRRAAPSGCCARGTGQAAPSGGT